MQRSERHAPTSEPLRMPTGQPGRAILMPFESKVRHRALMAHCPRCGSPPGIACEGRRRPRKAVHVERIAAPVADGADLANIPAVGGVQ